MTTLRHTYDHLNEFLEGARAKESPLPASPPLSLTRNFVWVFAACGAILCTVPVLAGYLASIALR